MIARLARHTFPDDPAWEIVSPHIPVGTCYEVVGYEAYRFAIGDDTITPPRRRQTPMFKVIRLDGTNPRPGWMPCDVLEVVSSVEP